MTLIQINSHYCICLQITFQRPGIIFNTNKKILSTETWKHKQTIESQREGRGGVVGTDKPMNLYVHMHNLRTQTVG